MRRDIGIVVATALALIGAIAAVPRPSASASPREAHAPPALTTEEESALGWLASAPLAARHGGVLASNDALVRQVREVGARLATTATAKASPWRFAFVVVDEATPTALALPGGDVMVSRALVASVAGRDDALAAILAHQMGHVLARHAAPSMAADGATRGLLATLDSRSLDERSAADTALAIVLRARMDDDAEPAADALAARLLMEAGVDAAAARAMLHAPAPAPFHGAAGDVKARERRLASLVGTMK
jgi:predicted Zn-dependent protease